MSKHKEDKEKDLEQEVLTEEQVAEENTEEEVQEDQTEEVSQEEILQAKVAELEAANAELKDQMLRRQAELENYRKRLIRDKEEAVQFANESLIRDILGFLDNMERALTAAKNGGDVNALIEGFEMTQNQLLSTLDKNWGLKAIESVGQEFDPSLHEACMMTVDENLDKETVLEEFQKGYTLHDRVIRPSKVKIGKPE
ncbi:MAG: nucleotide exchange factor GrpE [Spirochaetales bacterium]|nr:nucleotide exchange factor GrpE [Spirochaetales bacterium]MBQ9811590.1 nucleotide exchange factor GrpE [Spirochaetales bacterium]MBR0519936.1 nucleotide exchange factor GrpE [Spirochaetales bacterium]MBR6234458.1 nucleotide exchange factor GrpE [Spirochaetales bacterium]MCR5443175.1 nucleotide exchange factor GrpE [Sphaerochaetaceae bacterium]